MAVPGDQVDQQAAEAEEVRAALDALDLARRRFVNVVGHELRTPVTTLRGLTEELTNADPGAIRDELGPAIIRSARRVEELLDDLLMAADIVTALPVGDPEPIDLVATAQAIWDSMDAGTELVLEGATEAVAPLRPGAGDQLMERVLDNARRYGTPPVALRTEVADRRVRLTVSSGGEQLSPGDVELAFELFYRGEGAVTTAPGFGLGLPVARALARQHDGDVTIHHRATGGLDVVVDLPSR